MNKLQGILPPLLFGAVLTGLWQLGVFNRIFNISQLQLPLPSKIIGVFISHLTAIGQNAVTTIAPAAVGLILGALLGYGMALVIAAFPQGGYGLMILVTIVNAIPIIALAPLMNRWFTVPFITKLAVIMVAASGSMTVHALQGLKNVAEEKLDLMHSCAAGKWEVFLRVRIPNSLPSVFSGLKIGVSAALLATIISEFFSKETSGIGYMIKHSLKVGNQRPLGWAYILAMSLFSVALYAVICILERRLIRWHASRR